MKTKNIEFRKWFDHNKCKFRKEGGGFVINADSTKEVIKDLTKNLTKLAPGSTGLIGEGWKIRKNDFRLGFIPGRGTTDPKYPEAKAERKIFNYYQTVPGTLYSEFLRSIHSFQVPLYARAHDSVGEIDLLGDCNKDSTEMPARLGEIDLLGATDAGLPAVIELKCFTKPSRSVGSLLGPIIQGLAYALTIRHYWASPSCEFRKEWLELEHSCDLPKTLEGQTTPIIVAGDSNFWSAPSTWSKCPWSHFVDLANALEEAGLPLFAARFESSERPKLEFAPFADLRGCEVGTDPLWPTNAPFVSEPI